jgi:hypothetical protein
MSWSIYLDGPKSQVDAELCDATHVIDKARFNLKNVKGSHVSVSLSGHAYGDEGSGTQSASFTVNGYSYTTNPVQGPAYVPISIPEAPTPPDTPAPNPSDDLAF